ncbi:MAG: amidohydrolase family protein [Chloroflexota bacterium]
MDLAIINGKVVTEHTIYTADVGVSEGRIVALTTPGTLPPAKETVDATDLLVLPGAIDIHFHARTPAYPERGDFYTETRAAAAGGVTTIYEMPISKPGCATPEIFRNRRQLAEAQCVVDFALFGAPGTLNRTDVLEMVEEGAIAFKIFMHRAPLGREDEFIGICLTDDDSLHQALKLVKETGKRLVVHCESDDMLEAGIARLLEAERHDLQAHMDSRPPVVEAVAVARLLTLAEDTGTPVHVAHVSSAHALRVIERFQRDGLDVTAETCPHYLFFDETDYLRLGPYAKINPPIRSADNQAALWQGIADDSLGIVTTDHSTYLVKEKERGWKGVWRSPSGAPGVQTLVPIMMTAALQGRLPLTQVVRLLCSEPARLFDIAPRKGALLPGADADICLYDPRPATTMRYEDMVSQARDVDKLYRDVPLQGKVTATFVRGIKAFADGEVLAPAGTGRFVKPNRQAAT